MAFRNAGPPSTFARRPTADSAGFATASLAQSAANETFGRCSIAPNDPS
jgi:hypothetical protein